MAAALRHVDVAHAAVAAHPTWVAAAAVWVAAVAEAVADIARHRAGSEAAVGVAAVAAVVVVLSAPAQDARVAAAAVARPEHPAAAREGGRQDPRVAAPPAASADNHRLSLPTLRGSDTLAPLEVDLLVPNLRSP